MRDSAYYQGPATHHGNLALPVHERISDLHARAARLAPRVEDSAADSGCTDRRPASGPRKIQAWDMIAEALGWNALTDRTDAARAELALAEEYERQGIEYHLEHGEWTPEGTRVIVVRDDLAETNAVIDEVAERHGLDLAPAAAKHELTVHPSGRDHELRCTCTPTGTLFVGTEDGCWRNADQHRQAVQREDVGHLLVGLKVRHANPELSTWRGKIIRCKRGTKKGTWRDEVGGFTCVFVDWSAPGVVLSPAWYSADAVIPADPLAWPLGKTFGQLTTAQQRAAQQRAGARLEAELTANAEGIGKVMDEAQEETETCTCGHGRGTHYRSTGPCEPCAVEYRHAARPMYCDAFRLQLCGYSAAHAARGIASTTTIDCGPVGIVPACQPCADFYARMAGA